MLGPSAQSDGLESRLYRQLGLDGVELGLYKTQVEATQGGLAVGEIALLDLRARLAPVHLARVLRHSENWRADYYTWESKRPECGGLASGEVWDILREFLANPGIQAELLIQYQLKLDESKFVDVYLNAASVSINDSTHQGQLRAFNNYFNNNLGNFDQFVGGCAEWRRTLGLVEFPSDPATPELFDQLAQKAWAQALFFKHMFGDIRADSLTAPEVIASLLGLSLDEEPSENWLAFLRQGANEAIISRIMALCWVVQVLMCEFAPKSAEELWATYLNNPNSNTLAVFKNDRPYDENVELVYTALCELIEEFALKITRRVEVVQREAVERDNAALARRQQEARNRESTCELNSRLISQFFKERQRPPPPEPSIAILNKDESSIPKSWTAHFGNFISATELILEILDYRGSDHGESAAKRMIEELRLGDRIFTRRITAQDIGSQGIKKLVDLLFDPMNLCCVLQALSKNTILDRDIKTQFRVAIPHVTPRVGLARELATLYDQDIAAREAIDQIIRQDDLNLFVATLLLPKPIIVQLKSGGGAGFPQAIKDALTSAQDASERIATIKEKRPPRGSAAGKGEAQEVDIATLRKELGDAANGWALVSDGFGGVLAVRERDNLEVELNPSDLVGGKKAIKAFGKKVDRAEKDRPAQGLIDTLLGFGFTWREMTLIHVESGLQVVLNGNLSEKLADLGRLKTAISGYQSQQSELRQVLIESNRILVLDNRDEFAYHFESSGEEHEIDLPPIPHAKITEVLDGARRSAQALVDCTDRSANAALKGEAKQARLFNEYHERLQIKPSSQVLILDANIIFDLVRGQVNGKSLSRILSVLAKVPDQKILIPATVVFEVLGWIPPEDWSPQGGYLLFPSSERRHLTDLLRNRFSVCTVNEQGELSPLGSDFSRSSKLVVVFTEADRALMQKVRAIETNSDLPAADRRIAIKKLFVGRDLGEHRIIDLLSLIPQTAQPRQVYTRDQKFKRGILRRPNLELSASPVGLFVQAAAALPKDVAEVFALSPELAAGQLVDPLVAGLRRYR